MPIPASKRRNNDIYNAKCDRISARPLKPVGNAIRAAAQHDARMRTPLIRFVDDVKSVRYLKIA